MTNPENLLNIQPSPEESEREELITSIENTKDVGKIVDIIYKTGNTHLVRAYHETRLEFLKEVMPNSMSEYQDVTEDGFLVKESLEGKSDEEIAEITKYEPISAVDAVTANEKYLENAIPELLDALTVSDYDDLDKAA